MQTSRPAEKPSPLPHAEWLAGITRAVPVMLGYVTVGFAYGVLAQDAGLSLFNGVLMSLAVYAGSAQLIGAGMFAMAAHPLSIILTTFIVNLRHLLMSAAIAPRLRDAAVPWTRAEITLFGLELTDETFALHASTFARETPSKASLFASNAASQLSWIIGSALGMLAGSLIGDIRPFGLDFVLSAMFIALIFMQLQHRRQLLIAVLAGLLSMLLLAGGMAQWNVILATVATAAVGVLLEEPWKAD
ncbi:MAG: AzlC family ABC transporter permease [Anaerolineae bacterium]|nr:AzlC family ABC transporter permease [Anaerolineae bacterium]